MGELRDNNRWLIALCATAMAFIEVMDMTIVSVSLRHMRADFSATTAQITWTISIYIISAAIVMPLSGFLMLRYGRKRVLLYSIIGFGLSSVLCGLASSLVILIFCRALQGAFGAPLAPIAQAIMAEAFQGSDRNKAMSLFSIGIMTAPLFGPIIGGYLNDSLSWRFSFFINVPICFFIMIIMRRLLTESQVQSFSIDWLGVMLIILGIGGIQFILELGNTYDWFNSFLIFSTTILAITSILLYIINSCNKANALIPLNIFLNRNFLFSIVFGIFFSAGFMGSISILPMQLQSLYGLPAQSVGWLLAPRGLASILLMLFMPVLMKRYDSKYLVMLGFIFFALGTYLLSRQSYIAINENQIIIATVLQGMSSAFFFVPLSVVAYKNMSRSVVPQASGFFNFARTLGSSIGVSFTTLIYERLFQQNWNNIISHIRTTNDVVLNWIESGNLDITNINTIKLLHDQVFIQANRLAYSNSYLMLSLILIMGAFIVAIMIIMENYKSFFKIIKLSRD